MKINVLQRYIERDKTCVRTQLTGVRIYTYYIYINIYAFSRVFSPFCRVFHVSPYIYPPPRTFARVRVPVRVLYLCARIILQRDTINKGINTKIQQTEQRIKIKVLIRISFILFHDTTNEQKRTRKTGQNYIKKKPKMWPKNQNPKIAADALKFAQVYSYTILHPKTRQRALKCVSIFMQL